MRVEGGCWASAELAWFSGAGEERRLHPDWMREGMNGRQDEGSALHPGGVGVHAGAVGIQEGVSGWNGTRLVCYHRTFKSSR